MPAPDSTAADAPDPAVPACRTRRAVLSAGAAVAVSMTLALTSYVGEWQDVVVHGAAPEVDDWLALAGALWLPVVIAALTGLFRQHARLSARAERATELFRDTAHTASGWIWQIDVGYRITYSSAGVLDLLGHHPADVIGRNPMDLLVFDEDRERIDADVQATFSTGGWHNWQTRVKHRDDSVRYVRSSATPVYGKNGDCDPARAAPVLAMSSFAASLGMAVVAEGVENEAELCVLADAGIPYAQGFHLGRPAAVPLPDRSGRIAVPQLPEPTIV